MKCMKHIDNIRTLINNLISLRAGGRGWLWGGCSDNLDFGERISKQYVDAQETGQDSRAAVNLHNNAAGRQVSRHATAS